MLIKVRVLRTDRFSNETYEAVGELSIQKNDKGIHVSMTKGGETGFENFTVSPSKSLIVNEWCACSGRKNEYDRVVVPKAEMERAYHEAGILS